MRLFTGLALPEDLRRRIVDLPQRVHGARFVPFDNLHLTLRFLGEVADADVPGLEALLSEVSVPPFDLEISGGGVFPARGPARILWLGARLEPELLSLKGQIDRVLRAAGFEREKRGYHPHVTLARCKRCVPKEVERYLGHVERLEATTIRVTSFELFESQLRPQGAEYRVHKVYELT